MQNIGLPGPARLASCPKKFLLLGGAVGLLMSQLFLYPTLTKKLGLLAARHP